MAPSTQNLVEQCLLMTKSQCLLHHHLQNNEGSQNHRLPSTLGGCKLHLQRMTQFTGKDSSLHSVTITINVFNIFEGMIMKVEGNGYHQNVIFADSTMHWRTLAL